jgi:hypothetical protein
VVVFGVLVVVAELEFVLAGGGVFFVPKILENNPGFLGGSCGGSGMVARPAVAGCLVSAFTGGLFI